MFIQIQIFRDFLLTICLFGLCIVAPPVSLAADQILIDPTRPEKKTLTIPSKTTPKIVIKRNKKRTIPNLKLQQTLISSIRKLAVINGKSLQIGEKIRGVRIKRIKMNSVEVLYRGKKHTLHITHPVNIKEIER